MTASVATKRAAAAGAVISLDELLDDPVGFAPLFRSASWDTWRTIGRAIEGRSPRADDLETFRTLTGRENWPTTPPREVWVAAGRRGGKTRFAALLGVHRACFVDYRPFLAPGERAVVMLLATDRTQARVAMRYVRGLLRAVPMLERLVEREAAESIDLRNGVSIEIHTSSFRATRGYTLACVIADEVSFWRSDESAANPADEVLTALRPGLATIPGAPLIAVSTPYARSGPLWRAFDRHYGRDGSDVLVVKAPTRVLNPTLPEHVIVDALADDEAAARAEYLAEFRVDLESYVDRGVVERSVVPHRAELPPRPGVNYVAFTDPSGGKSDSFTLAIAHRDGDRAVLDVLRERKPPFSPDAVVGAFAGLCRAYGLSRVTGDKYAAAWVEERFSAHGLRYDRSSLSKSELYAALLPQLNSGRVELVDVPAVVAQLVGLERRVARGTGRDSIDHALGARDDLANVVAGVVHLTAGRRRHVAQSFDPDTLFQTGRLEPNPPSWWPAHWPAEWYRAGRSTP